MNLSEAKQAIAVIQRFFRALPVFDNLMDAAIAAENTLAQVNNKVQETDRQIQANQNEIASLEKEIEGLSVNKAKLKVIYDNKMAEIDAKLNEWADKQKSELQEQIADLEIKLATMATEEKSAKAEYDANMKMHAGQEQEAKESVKYWQNKLSEAQAEFEAFKKRLS